MLGPPEDIVLIYTLGHSNRPFEEFVELVNAYEIAIVVDIRRYPSSRKWPHYNQPVLRSRLTRLGIEYIWLEALGGRRRPSPDSVNTAITRAGFRAYADHMASDSFRHAVDQLLQLAHMKRAAVMCAERFYWRCHRRFLADYLLTRGAKVIHILDLHRAVVHKLSPQAVSTCDGRLIYPARDLWHQR